MNSDNEQAIVDQVIQDIGKDIRLAIPLGVGKAIRIANAFYERAKNDPQISLKIYTALTLTKPRGQSLLEYRFLEPFVDRVFGNYIDPLYELDQNSGSLPKNIEVFEFYFQAGKKLKNRSAQENYICSNYTHVARDLIDAGVNVMAQMVAPSKDGNTFSLSCNPDVSLDLSNYLNEKKPYPFANIAQVNQELPFMYGDAIVNIDFFDHSLVNEDYNDRVFGPPKMSVPLTDYMIGLYASILIKDGGELQVGIGSLGDALVHFLLLRHKNTDVYKNLVNSFKISSRYSSLLRAKGGMNPFQKGLFAASEMFVDGFMHLFEAKILKKKVYEHIVIQRLLNEGLISHKVDENLFRLLIERGAIFSKLNKKDFDFLQNFGIFRDDVEFDGESIILSDGELIPADLSVPENINKIVTHCLGDQLKKGSVIHGGFFLGPQSFYKWLKKLPDEKRKLIHMKSVTKINQLYGHEEIDRLHRKDARFINTCFLMTLSGAAVSDGLEDGRVVSGVGGQYNFVSMAHALPDGHSILQLRSTRENRGKVTSNIVFNYGHITIPRHLRDIVITEYGIADLRGKTDSEVAAALIEIADSRFQNQLIQQVKTAGKLKETYQLPDIAKQNTPENINRIILQNQWQDLFPRFPFGTDFTDAELQLAAALKFLKKKSVHKFNILILLIKSFFISAANDKTANLLDRMSLEKPISFKEKMYRRLLISALEETSSH